MIDKKKPDLLNITILFLIIISLVLAGHLWATIIRLRQSSAISKSNSSVISFFEYPIIYLGSAKIIEVNPDSINIEMSKKPFGNAEADKLILQIKISDSTNISKPILQIPYRFKQINTEVTDFERIKISDLVPGQITNITLAEDLRFSNSNSINAKSITTTDELQIINGKVTEINDNSIALSGTKAPTNSVTENLIDPQLYNITVSDSTEISSSSPTDFTKISIQDLSPGDLITIYSGTQSQGTSYEAALIELHRSNASAEVNSEETPPAVSAAEPVPIN